jgi:hypothetical protein
MYSYTAEGKTAGNVERIEQIFINIRVGNTNIKIFGILSVINET